MARPSSETPCRITGALGRPEPCPYEACAFWEPGGVVLDGRCAFERLDLAGRPQLAQVLLDVRRALEAARTTEEQVAAERAFHRLLNQGGYDG
jgi:hypothetical protein